MSDMSAYLFIGGPKDGARIDLPDPVPPHWEVAEAHPKNPTLRPSLHNPPDKFWRHTYRKQRLEPGRFIVFVHESLDLMQVLARLLHYYPRIIHYGEDQQ